MAAASPLALPQRQGSRHKPRRMVALSLKLYDRLSQLARRHGRPLSWQLRLILERALIGAGLMREDEATIKPEDENDD